MWWNSCSPPSVSQKWVNLQLYKSKITTQLMGNHNKNLKGSWMPKKLMRLQVFRYPALKCLDPTMHSMRINSNLNGIKVSRLE